MAGRGTSRWSVRLFGKLTVQRNDQVVSGLDAGKPLELFGYLLLHGDRAHSRESLAALLWGDVPTARSKKYLRHTLWKLQATLGDHGSPKGDHVLAVDAYWLRLSPSADLWLDVTVFEQALTSTKGLASRDLDASCSRLLEEAVRLYQGDLLEGCYQDWCLFERERLRNAYLIMLDKLMGYCEAHADYETAAAYGMQILRHDRAHERTHRRLMRLHYLAGDRAGAIREYQRCVTALGKELGVTPSPLTQRLYEEISADNLDVASTEIRGELTGSRLSTLLRRLRQLRADLAEAEHEVRQEILAAAPAGKQALIQPHRR